MENKKLVIQPKRMKGEDGFKTFSVRIRKEIVSQIDEVALKTNRSRNELIGMFLEYALKECVIESESERKSSSSSLYYLSGE